MPDREHLLQQYIQRLLDVQDQQDDGLTEADLERIAADLGLDEADRAHVAELVEDHQQRGLTFAAHHHWDEAIQEYRQAVALRPLQVPLLHKLALAHQARWLARHDGTDREAALSYVKRCIRLDPQHQPSYTLLTALKVPRNKRKVVALMTAIGLMVIALMAVMAWGLMHERQQTPAPMPALEVPITRSSPVPLEDRPSEWHPEVQLLTDETTEGLSISVHESTMRRYNSSYAYALKAHLATQRDEVYALQFRMEGKDRTGAVLIQKTVDVLESHHPYLRPGEVRGFHKLIFEKEKAPDVEQVEFSLANIERAPAPDTYAAMPAQEVVWDVPHPNQEVAFEERESVVTHNDLLNQWRHDLTLAVANTGPRAIQRLKIQVDWLDDAAQVMHSNPSWIVSASEPPFQPGQRTAVRTFGTFAPGAPRFTTYRIHIIEIQ